MDERKAIKVQIIHSPRTRGQTAAVQWIKEIER